MPIIEPCHADSPITQGDILQNIPLYRTVVAEGEPKSEKSKSPLCMVISRPCNIAHKTDLLVAEIVRYTQSAPKGIESFDHALDFLRTQRDGIESPDRFYLGEIPGQEGRFVAKLDALFTLSSNDKSKLLDNRIAALNEDFQRDLHLRVFNAIANLGFDDVDWLPTVDLKFLKTIGESELANLNQLAAVERANKAKQDFGDNKFDQKKLDKIEQSIKALETAMAPYISKLNDRNA